MIVCKFGGTSLADAQQIRQVKAILDANPERTHIVVSAPGKRDADDIKMTDLLLTCHRLAERQMSIDEPFEQIEQRFLRIAEQLGLPTEWLCDSLEQVRRQLLSGASRAYAMSRGEYLSARLISAYLDWPFMDAAACICFQDNGYLDEHQTQQRLSQALSPLSRCVFPGFYGAKPNGDIHLFSRGGSDVSGALVARALNAECYENWTDVCGFRAADPRIVHDAKFIQHMTYRELRELSYMGATVLHEDAVFPVKEAGIPTKVLNTFEPYHPGTSIHYTNLAQRSLPHMTGIAGKKHFSSIVIEKHHMNNEVGFVQKVLQVLSDRHISFDHMPTSIDECSIILPTSALENQEAVLLQDIQAACQPDSIAIKHNLALLTCVGHDVFYMNGVIARLFHSLSEQGIAIHTTLLSPSRLSMIVGIDESQLDLAISTLYDAFIRT